MTASTQEDTMKAITSEFFGLIPRDGFPPLKQQTIKWAELGLPQPVLKKDSQNDRNVVVVSMRHDYGEAQLSPVPVSTL
jgi:hypothetical protein